MKKVLLITFIFISSFFFFNLKHVYAIAYSYNINENDLALVNDNFFDFRNQVIDFCGDSKIYIIYYWNSKYNVIIADKDSSYSLKFNPIGSSTWFIANNFDVYEYKSNTLTYSSTITTNTNIFVNNDASRNFFYLDTNIDNIAISGSNSFSVIYNGKSYSIPEYNLYKIYLDNFAPSEPEDPYEEEKALLSSFYTISIEKISYLTNSFATNYIFLTILGVFIVLYVIELLRRLLR